MCMLQTNNTHEHIFHYQKGIALRCIISVHTVQTFNSCTSRPDVCQFLIVQTPMGNIYRNTPSTSVTLTLLAHQSYVQF